MTPEEIIAMAREASSMARLPWNGEWIFRSKKELLAFSALVAAKEREVCAKVCDELAELNRTAPADSMWQWGECAAAIRARAKKDGA